MKLYLKTYLCIDRELFSSEPAFERLYTLPWAAFMFPLFIIALNYFPLQQRGDSAIMSIITFSFFAFMYYLFFAVRALHTMMKTRKTLGM